MVNGHLVRARRGGRTTTLYTLLVAAHMRADRTRHVPTLQVYFFFVFPSILFPRWGAICESDCVCVYFI